VRWLAWRQLRTQVLVTAAVLTVLAAFLVYLGLDLRAYAADHVVGCPDARSCELAQEGMRTSFNTSVVLLSGLLVFAPALLGAFWGAPLVAREVETGTHRLVWSQSVTRRHWLKVKLAWVFAAGLAACGIFTWLLTWAAEPFDEHVGSRFAAFTFGARGVVPLGYAALALAAGVAIGLVVRRTLPALALTMAAMAVVQVAMPLFVRPHLLPPVTDQVAVDGDSLSRLSGLYLQGDHLVVEGYQMTGAWVLSGLSTMRDAAGRTVTPATTKPCMDASTSPSGAGDCLEKLDLHFDVTYQPANRYWPFQGIEAGAMVLLAALLVGFCRWRIPRGIP
jgi:hypothetical protein